LHAVKLGNEQVSHPACGGIIRYFNLYAVELGNDQVSYLACPETREYTGISSCMQ